jgi:hypothetical protein
MYNDQEPTWQDNHMQQLLPLQLAPLEPLQLAPLEPLPRRAGAPAAVLPWRGRVAAQHPPAAQLPPPQQRLHPIVPAENLQDEQLLSEGTHSLQNLSSCGVSSAQV